MTQLFQSIGRNTDMMFSKCSGEVIDRGTYVVIRTVSNPGYHWGNYLVYRRPPQLDDLQQWNDDFQKEMSHYKRLQHILFAWDSQEQGDIQSFVDAGFVLEEAIVLQANDLTLPKYFNDVITVRELVGDDEWAAVTDLAVRCRDPEYSLAEYRRFKSAQMEIYKRMALQGKGDWYGAFLDDRMVANLGLFYASGLARYQYLLTAPEYRRLGVCGTLVYETGRRALTSKKVNKLVMEADPDYCAARIYEAVGFLPIERNYSLVWHPDVSFPVKWTTLK